MDIASFVTSLLTSFLIFVVLVLVFTWLSRRPGNAPVYYPNVLLRGLDPWEGRGRGTRSPVGWIQQAFRASEADVVHAGGVDAAVYLVFLSSGTANANRPPQFHFGCLINYPCFALLCLSWLVAFLWSYFRFSKLLLLYSCGKNKAIRAVVEHDFFLMNLLV
jgi:hypothetical protein